MEKNNEEKSVMKGIVKWFDSEKGYGFITVDELGKDVFVHFTNINKDGFKTLEKNELVTFDYDEEKDAAFNVVKLEEQ